MILTANIVELNCVFFSMAVLLTTCNVEMPGSDPGRDIDCRVFLADYEFL